MFVFKAAVVGAGTMGGQIAQTIAAAGIPVVLKDIRQELVDHGDVRVLDLAGREARDLDDGHLCRDPVCLPPGGEPCSVCPDPRAPAGDPRVLVVETTRHRIVEHRPARREYRTWAA